MTTKEQQAIIETNERHVVVMAGAGCGKTYTIVERVHELLARGVPPCAIVVLTFSKAAARELKHRIGERGVHVGTFHSFILSLMSPRPNVLSQEEAEALVLECAMQTGAATFSKGKLKANKAQLQRECYGRWPTALGKMYASQLAIRGDIDYDGILLEGLKMDIAPQHLIIDEAQDNDIVQWNITKKIAEKANTLIVGDENQCIHEWRSARPEEFMGLPWPRLHLTETFRCHQAIVDEANSIEGITLQLRTAKPAGNVVHSDNVSPDDVLGACANNRVEEVAVLCRYNTDVDWWTEVMDREGVQVARRENAVGALHWVLRWLYHPMSNTARQKAAQEIAPYRVQGELFTPLLSTRGTGSVGELTRNWLTKLGVSYGPAEIFDALQLPDMLWAEAKAIADTYRGETLDWYMRQEMASSGMERVTPGLNIRTIHSAKGLEWDRVIMPNTPKDARLNYVGTTRAKTLLIKGK